MPKMPTTHTKFPADWDKVSEKLDEFEQKMRDGSITFIYWLFFSFPFLFLKLKQSPAMENVKLKHFGLLFVSTTSVLAISTRCITRKNRFLKRATTFCLKNGYADANLIAKWKKVFFMSKLCKSHFTLKH